MNVRLSPEKEEMRKSVRHFFDHTVDPLADRIEKEGHILDHIMQMSKDMGLLGLSIPEEYGGLDIGTSGQLNVISCF